MWIDILPQRQNHTHADLSNFWCRCRDLLNIKVVFLISLLLIFFFSIFFIDMASGHPP